MRRSAEPPCLGNNSPNEFLSPDYGAGLEISAGQEVQVSWYGGRNESYVQVVSLWLMCSNGGNISIVDSGSFILKDTPSSNLTYLTDCGNTKLSYNWTAPDYADLVSEFDIESDVQFNFKASSQTANVTSPSFVIVKEAASTSTTPTSSSSSIILTNPPDTSTTPSPTASSSYPIKSNSTSLSTGAKAGIGIGCVAFVLAVLGAFIYMKRARTKDELAKQQRERFEKPELSGEAAPKRAVEIDGAKIHEMDGQAQERQPPELASG